MRTHLLGLLATGFTITACSSGPPPDFAPTPELLSALEGIEIEAPGFACPGERVEARYYGITNTGRRVLFDTRYDDDNPPELHVVMLDYSSRDAVADNRGRWRLSGDPLQSAHNGFRLSASLRQQPSLAGSTNVIPDYRCLRTSYVFDGSNGRRGETGENGPDVSVSLDIGSSPYYDRLLVVGIQVGFARPFYVLADAEDIPTADLLRIVSRGGRGGRGLKGEVGAAGLDGEAGCPGEDGGPGGPGGPGGIGGTGGRGGQISVTVPRSEPFLAGLIDAVSVGGEGGRGGPGGDGGPGGEGGEASSRRCADGADGENGPDGEPGTEGREGREGPDGPRTVIVQEQDDRVFRNPPAAVREILGID